MRGVVIAAVAGMGLSLAATDAPRAQERPPIDEDRAVAVVKGGLGGVCELDRGMVATMRPEVYRLDEPPAYEGGEDRHYVLYAVACSSGAYNVTWVFLVDEGYDGPMPQGFATPKLRIDYEDDAQERLRSVRVDGFESWFRLTNARFDPETRTVVSNGLWRGLGDASDSGTWAFEEGRFVLQRYEVDPTYDGEVTPQVVFER